MNNVTSEILALRKTGGFLPLQDYGIIEVTGRDATSFLQARTSNNVNALESGTGQLTSLLDRKAHVLAIFSLHRLDERYFVLAETAQLDAILKQFETYHFAEKVEYRILPVTLYSVHGPKADFVLSQIAEIGETIPVDDFSVSISTIGANKTPVVRRSLTGDPGFILVLEDSQLDVINTTESVCRAAEMAPLSQQALEVARIEAGILRYGVDVTEEQLLPETALENEAASYAKGCFQGQEVLARIRTYGAPRRGMVGLIFAEAPAESFPLKTDCSIDSKEAATLMSNTSSPTLNKFVSFAYVMREYRVPDQILELVIDGKSHLVTVITLPFYAGGSGRKEADKLYKQGLHEFTHGSEDRAIELLLQAIEFDPFLADAYESLGVILSRHERFDEAINWMKRLAALDKESIMAHANLSVFYMQKGDKETAEEEKAIAMSIRMAQAARQMAAQKKEETDKAKQREEAESRMSMFRQVLQIDAEDFLANQGMGSIYVELEQYEEALPFLLKAIESRPNHTVAYLALGKAYEKLNRIPDAIDAYKTGVSVGAQRGEVTPMKEMQARLSELELKVNESGSRK